MKTKTIHRSRLTKNFTTLSNEMLQNDNISHLALGLLCRMLSLPPDWETNLVWIYGTRKEGKKAMQVAVKELESLGYLKKTRLGTGKMLWEWFDNPQGVIASEGIASDAISTTTKDRVKKVRGVSSASPENEKKKEKGGFVPKRTKFSQDKNFKPLFPYPQTEEEMVSEIEIRGYEPNLDYDGNFFAEFHNRGWRMPNGDRVWNWFELYQSRVLKTTGSDLEPCSGGGF